MKSFDYKKLVKGSEKWFSKASKEWMWDEPREKIQEYLLVQNSRYGLLTSIGKLAAWAAREGCVQVGNRNEDGWQNFIQYFASNLGCLKIEVEGAKLSRNAEQADPTLTPFHLLAMAMAMRQTESVRWLGDAIIEARSNTLFGYDWGDKRQDPFRNYVCELYARGAGSGNFSDDFGPYAGIFEHWEDLSRLSDAIRAACDYHVEQIDVKAPEEIGVFENNPHDIFPAEILALYRVREWLGLTTLEVDHPLLKTPFCEVPKMITYEPDPLVEQALALAHKLLPQAVKKIR